MSKPVTVTDATFAGEVLDAEGVTIVDFWAPWCGPCRQLSPVIERVAADYAGTVRVAKLDVDDNPQTAAQYGVRGIPTLLVFHDGDEITRFVGYQPRQVLASALDAVLALPDAAG